MICFRLVHSLEDVVGLFEVANSGPVLLRLFVGTSSLLEVATPLLLGASFYG